MNRIGAAWHTVAPRGSGRRLAWIALALSLVWSGFEGAMLLRAQQLNRQLASGTPPPDSATAPAEVRFAQAYALAASGAFDAALNRYGSLQDDSPLGQAARYNSANLLLRQGMALRAAGQDGQALALIELAKEGYRELLRANPLDWPARYNLERAQRLVPDPMEADDAPPDVNRSAERAATTMRGYSPGLP